MSTVSPGDGDPDAKTSKPDAQTEEKPMDMAFDADFFSLEALQIPKDDDAGDADEDTSMYKDSEDLFESTDLAALGDLADEDIFPEDIDELPDFKELDKNLKQLNSDPLDEYTETPARDASSSSLTTPRVYRAQSEALDTHIQKPTLQPYPASVPHSPTGAAVNSKTRFLPPSFHPPPPLSTSSGSPASRKPSVFSKPRHADKSSTLQAINGATGERPEMQQYPTAANLSTSTSTGDSNAGDAPPRVSAYARLDFQSFTFYVQTLQVILGRGAENSSMVDVDLGPVKAISRRHAKIFYNFGTQRFEMSVLGRNGAFVDDTFVDSGSTVPLKDA